MRGRREQRAWRSYSSGPVLIRSWNLFHGNSCPPGRRSYLEEMVRVASADRPDVLLLQEVPVWAFDRLGGWSGMTAVADVAQRPRLGPLPIPAELGRRLTGIAPGLLRSAFSGQGNAILLDDGLRVGAHDVLTLNPAEFRRAEAKQLGLDPIARLAWAKERRICQLVRVLREDGPAVVVAHLHATSSPAAPRIPEAEVRRASAWVDSRTSAGDVVVFGGDFNFEAHSGPLLSGYSDPGPGIDHVLVRGTEPSPPRAWPDDRRRRHGVLLSDHTPVELEIP
jgi:endonuclease/exonuclease/phosphatase family metal-dependent hydrolase